MRLEAIRGALAADQIDEALSLALDEWRRAPAPEIAAVIDLLDARARPRWDAPRARTKAEFQAAWLAAAQRPEPVATGWLADTVTKLVDYNFSWGGLTHLNEHSQRKLGRLLPRLDQLRARGPDPRVARAALEQLREARLPVGNEYEAEEVYGRLIAFIEAADDVRALEPLRELARIPTARVVCVRAYLAARLPHAIARLAARAPALDEPGRAAWRALLDELGGAGRAGPRASTVDGEALLAQIRARPDDDAARLVYADWLCERGDPLGELIVLQERIARGAATENEEKRARALLRRHRDAWLGPLAPVLRAVELERGFLSRAELVQNRAASDAGWHAAALDPRLATLKHLGRGLGNAEHYRRFLLSPALRALESAELPNRSILEELVAAPRPFRLKRLALAFQPTRADLERLAQPTPLLDGVHVLEVGVKTHAIDALFEALRASGWLSRLAELRVRPLGLGLDDSRAILAHWGSLPETLTLLRVVPHFELGGADWERRR